MWGTAPSVDGAEPFSCNFKHLLLASHPFPSVVGWCSPDTALPIGIHAGGGLVQQQHGGVPQQGQCHTQLWHRERAQPKLLHSLALCPHTAEGRAPHPWEFWLVGNVRLGKAHLHHPTLPGSTGWSLHSGRRVLISAWALQWPKPHLSGYPRR